MQRRAYYRKWSRLGGKRLPDLPEEAERALSARMKAELARKREFPDDKLGIAESA